MEITKRKLRRIIKEEKQKLLKEWGDSIETGSGLIDFAKAYAGLGGAVQDQVDAIVGAWINGGGPDSEDFENTVYEQNPNAIDLALERLGRLYMDGVEEEYGEIIDSLEAAKRILER
jgi:hypothetical protein|tara:strand:+ start:2497 stop:2847 length:351 start_codon:yes stop_codon:yes gene_type:complete